MENTVEVAIEDGVAGRIAAATAARTQRPDYASEVRALLEAARRVLATTGKLRVSDIVNQAGLSNDAFYRHFPSKDALVAALIEQGAERYATQLRRRMEEEPTPTGQVRCWVVGMLDQANEVNSKPTVAMLSSTTTFDTSLPTIAFEVARLPLARLLFEPFRALGSPDEELDAELVTHAITHRVARHLSSGTVPSDDEIDYLTDFCLRTASHR